MAVSGGKKWEECQSGHKIQVEMGLSLGMIIVLRGRPVVFNDLIWLL